MVKSHFEVFPLGLAWLWYGLTQAWIVLLLTVLCSLSLARMLLVLKVTFEGVCFYRIMIFIFSSQHSSKT